MEKIPEVVNGDCGQTKVAVPLRRKPSRTPSRYGPGGSGARSAVVMRKQSLRKSIKEVNAFRYSNFVDLLYFASKNEVCKALNKTRGLYQRWGELQQEQEGTGGGSAGAGIVVGSREELDWTNTELRNALRSIEWDLEDLEETIDILFTYNDNKSIYYIFSSSN
ncbi:hypothetical protein Pcinc_018868 [Petrolisthes cinctipes]|uniref:Syntaxin 6/10/61 N-terminal domain-containing protein n=1 Tax=Petrolisthes cinctipes TaxID=88211 RepID=A0AAE1FLQ0_PETCI|nr:hypothetical protein Pcinc_018868 [Petrolisthes cinctipes]